MRLYILTLAPCASCGARHENTALCDDCAPLARVAGEHPQSCDCASCGVARRAELALVDTDVDLYALPEVRRYLDCG